MPPRNSISYGFLHLRFSHPTLNVSEVIHIIMIKPFFSSRVLEEKSVTNSWRDTLFFLFFFLIRASDQNTETVTSAKCPLHYIKKELGCHEGSASLDDMCWPSAENFFALKLMFCDILQIICMFGKITILTLIPT